MTAQVINESFFGNLTVAWLQKRRNLFKPRLLWETSKKHVFVLGNA